jgi:hypothetical protein
LIVLLDHELANGYLLTGAGPFGNLGGLVDVSLVLGSAIDFSNGNLTAGALTLVVSSIDLLLDIPLTLDFAGTSTNVDGCLLTNG